MASEQASGSRRPPGTLPSDELVRGEARQRVVSPEEDEQPPVGVSTADGATPPVAAIPPVTASAGTSQPAAHPIVPVEIPPVVEPQTLYSVWEECVESDDDAGDDDRTVEIDPPEDVETDAAAEKQGEPREVDTVAENAAKSAAEAASNSVLEGDANPNYGKRKKAREAAKQAAKEARINVYNRQVFVRLGDALTNIGSGKINIPREILNIVAERYPVCKGFLPVPDDPANAADGDLDSLQSSVVEHFRRVYDIAEDAAESRVDIVKRAIEETIHEVVNDETNAERGWTRPARGGDVGDINLLDFPRLYSVMLTGLGVSIYEGQLPNEGAPPLRDPNVASTPLSRRFLVDSIVMLLDGINNSVPVPDEIASTVT